MILVFDMETCYLNFLMIWQKIMPSRPLTASLDTKVMWQIKFRDSHKLRNSRYQTINIHITIKYV